MSDLYITFALPNPAGKDRPPHGGPSDAQLNGEWIQFLNATGNTLDMNGVRLLHQTFDRLCQHTGQDEVTSFWGVLDPGYSFRVHTGSGQPWQEGTILHTFLGRSNYAWNNACGDTAVLVNQHGIQVDFASYAPNPPEGRILQRQQGTNYLR
jgi:hypothetical protein